LVFATSPTPLEWNEQGNIGEGDALVPLVDILDIDYLHDVENLLPCFILDRGKGVPSFDEIMDIALVEVDFDDPTTNVR